MKTYSAKLVAVALFFVLTACETAELSPNEQFLAELKKIQENQPKFRGLSQQLFPNYCVVTNAPPSTFDTNPKAVDPGNGLTILSRGTRDLEILSRTFDQQPISVRATIQNDMGNSIAAVRYIQGAGKFDATEVWTIQQNASAGIRRGRLLALGYNDSGGIDVGSTYRFDFACVEDA